MRGLRLIFVAVLLATILAGTVNAQNPTPTPPVTKIVTIIQFGDVEGGEANFWTLLTARILLLKTQGITPVIIGCGDYVVTPSTTSLGAFKSKVAKLIQDTKIPAENVILALGNHDDPGAVNTRFWISTFGASRPTEGIVQREGLTIAWMHSERPYLSTLSSNLATAKVNCPTCIPVLVGHKPLVLEKGMEAYKSFLLLAGWREQTLAIMKTGGVKLYLTGHLEYQNWQTYQDVKHSRTTPARRGFEEITIKYDPATGTVVRIDYTNIY
jgi:hypothetical protein